MKKLIITVREIIGRCPVYKVGDRIVLDEGYKVNLDETTAICMHSLASVMPYYVALVNGIDPKKLGLANAGKDNGNAYVQCLDPCKITNGGTVTLEIEV